MTDIWLGVIAVSLLVMAVAHVVAAIAAVRAARRGVEVLEGLTRDLQPILAHARTLSADVARAASMTAGQVERADAMLTQLSTRVEQTAEAWSNAWLKPARRGLARLRRKRPSQPDLPELPPL
jgi:hypothetical protein